jgi:hypothetical protein
MHTMGSLVFLPAPFLERQEGRIRFLGLDGFGDFDTDLAFLIYSILFYLFARCFHLVCFPLTFLAL